MRYENGLSGTGSGGPVPEEPITSSILPFWMSAWNEIDASVKPTYGVGFETLKVIMIVTLELVLVVVNFGIWIVRSSNAL